MGLDAVVYRRLEEIPFASGSDLSSVRVDELTGEVHFEDFEASAPRQEDTAAIKRRLGNMALVVTLHENISRILGHRGRNSLLLTKVLYDGTHAGDFIPIEDLDHLKDEVQFVRNHVLPSASAELEEFLFTMGELISVSEQQGNPIVFV